MQTIIKIQLNKIYLHNLKLGFMTEALTSQKVKNNLRQGRHPNSFPLWKGIAWECKESQNSQVHFHS